MRRSSRCTCECTCGKGQTVHPVPEEVLYKQPFRRAVLYFSWLIPLYNFGLLAVCIAAVPTSYWYSYSYSALGSTGGVENGVALFFFWCAIPLVLTTNSVIELFKRRRSTLRSRRLVITSSLGLVLLIIALGVWTPCAIIPEWNPSYRFRTYCPFPAGPGLQAYSWGVFLAPYLVIPILLMPALALYVTWVTIAACALRHEQRAQRGSISQASDVEKFEYRERYKVTSTLYTDVGSMSDDIPSTLHTTWPTPPPSTGPPSYGIRSSGGTSREESNRSSQTSIIHQEPEIAHVREI